MYIVIIIILIIMIIICNIYYIYLRSYNVPHSNFHLVSSMCTSTGPSPNLQHVLRCFCTRISVLPHISPFLLDVSQGAEIVYPADQVERSFYSVLQSFKGASISPAERSCLGAQVWEFVGAKVLVSKCQTSHKHRATVRVSHASSLWCKSDDFRFQATLVQLGPMLASFYCIGFVGSQ